MKILIEEMKRVQHLSNLCKRSANGENLKKLEIDTIEKMKPFLTNNQDSFDPEFEAMIFMRHLDFDILALPKHLLLGNYSLEGLNIIHLKAKSDKHLELMTSTFIDYIQLCNSELKYLLKHQKRSKSKKKKKTLSTNQTFFSPNEQ